MGESIQCWQCGTRMTLDELANNDGDCPRCEVEVHLAEYLDNALSKVAALETENAKLRAELRQWAVDGWKLVPVEPTPEMVSAAEEAHMPFGDMDIALRMAILAAPSAPSAPKADDPVKQMLLEALDNTATWIEQLPVPTVGAAGQLVKIDKAITAARQEVMK